VYPTQRVILATGGCSYPRTGSQGQGFALAARLGHRVVPPIPVLIPLRTHEAWSKRLAGTAFERVHLSTETKGKPVRETGALVFMQDGIGGPAALNLSRYLTEPVPSVDRPYRIKLDLLPDGDASSLERDLIEQCKAQPKRSISNLVAHWVPKRLAEQLCILVGCAHDLWSANLTKVQRRDLVQHLKALELSVIGTRPLAEATVTRGGVARDEIDDRTMASKIRPGLFFAGEVIDVDGPCGGYNLQICWSTGALAGRAAALRDST
jgi:predicted Rossmann fold flavoprotein